jgi:hypothetical protein
LTAAVASARETPAAGAGEGSPPADRDGVSSHADALLGDNMLTGRSILEEVFFALIQANTAPVPVASYDITRSTTKYSWRFRCRHIYFANFNL